ncbi:MAG: STAS domain-containing protein [bacterium]|nr:STAS domain-containing protein [bacterium]
MKINDYLNGDVVVFELSGKMIGGPATTYLRGRVQEYLALGKNRIVMDMAGIDRVNSVGLGVLTATNLSVSSQGGQLMLANITNVESLLTMTRLINVFTHSDSRVDAVNRLAGFQPPIAPIL